MDFFSSQDHARRRTSLLVFYFALAVAGIVAAVYGALFGILHYAEVPLDGTVHLKLLGGVALGTLAIVALGTLYKMAALRTGGEAVARMLGGQRIEPGSRVAAERRVLNVVEEMAIAAGVPVPPVFLIREGGINAFAAGYSPSDAVIGVTQGCIDSLTRDELQGVIAHEFSHILNGDMRLNIRLMGVLHGILVIALIGYTLMRTARVSGSGSKKGGNPLPLFGLALMLIGYIGVFFGKLIKSAVSRQREFLADAAAVQFTRNPSGIGGALRKIAGIATGSRLTHPHAEEASHLFFANGLRASFLGLMATHPPLAERIRRLEPHAPPLRPGQTAPAAAVAPDARAAGFATVARPPPLNRSIQSAVASVGNPTADHVAYAARLLAAIPEPVIEAARNVSGAEAVVFGLLLRGAAAEAGPRNLALDAETAAQLGALQPLLAALAPAARLPLIDVAIPALKQLSPERYARFQSAVTALIEADQEVDLFEYTLQHALRRHLDSQFNGRASAQVPTASLPDLLDPCTDLLSTLAYYGHDDLAAAEQAFKKGFARLGSPHARAMRPLDDCGLPLADAALKRLSQAYPLVKKRILDACVTTISHDGRIADDEGELVRAVADALGCPMPPLLVD